VEFALGDGAFAEEAGRDALRLSIFSANAKPTASGRPPPTMALPP
jgi:hypothetical protein